MSEEQTLRLAAEVVDRYSGPLRQMTKALRKLSDDVKGTHAAGVTQAKRHEIAFLDLNKQLRQFEDRMKQGVVPTMAALGVTTLSVAGAVAALKGATTGFAETTRQLAFLSRETGLSMDRLRQLDALARRLNIPIPAMRQGESDFAEHLGRLRRGVKTEVDAFTTGTNLALFQAAQQIAQLPVDQAMSAVVGKLKDIPIPEHKKIWLRLWGLPEGFANESVDEIRRQMAKIMDPKTGIGSLGAEARKSGLEFGDAIDKLGDSIERLKTEIGSNLAGPFTELTNDITKFVQANREGLIATLRELAELLKGADWKSFENVIVSAGTATAQFAKDLRSLIAELKQLSSGDLGSITPGVVPGSPADKAVKGWQGFDQWWRDHSGVGSKLYNRLFERQSYFTTEGSNPLLEGRGAEAGGLIKAAFTPGEASTGTFDRRAAQDAIARGTKTGVIEALREWKVESDADQGGGAGSGYGAGNYGSSGRVSARAGANAIASAIGGDADRRGPGAVPPMGERAAAGASADVGAGLQGSEYLAARRARFAEELNKNPQLRKQIAGMIATEGERDPVPVVESLMNRMDMEGKSLRSGLYSGFYGPINRGQLPGAIASLERNPKRMARMNAAIDAALAGSNTIKGATDQGMFSDPNGRWPGGRVIRGGQVFNDWGGSHYGHGGHLGSQEFREMLQRGVAGETARRSLPNIGHALGGVTPRPDLLQLGKQSGLLNSPAPLTGSASLDIRLHNFPRGTRTAAKFAGLFKELRLQPGLGMVRASEDG